MANVPQLVEELTKSRMKILDISKELAEKLLMVNLFLVEKRPPEKQWESCEKQKLVNYFLKYPLKICQ
ncbi:hypothetical protein ACIL82_09885 [Enterococcus faecium]